MKTSIASEERLSPQKKDGKSKCSIANYMPVLTWLPRYSQFDAVSDLVAGFSLGLTLIPQSIAYAALAGLTAQYGLYSCFVGAFVYIVFGTIKEVSIGPSSLMSLLTLEYTRNMPVEFVVLFCFLAGCVELLMGLCRLGSYHQYLAVLVRRYGCYHSLKSLDRCFFLGFLVDFISMPVTSGFTSATSTIIIVSQLQGLLGLKFKASSVADNIIKILQNFRKIRLPDFALGLSSIAFLLFFRKLRDFDCCIAKNENDDQRNGSNRAAFAKKILWFLSICRNALLILLASTVAFYFEHRGGSPFLLSGKIVSGLPKLSVPPFTVQVGNQTYTFIDMCQHYGTGLIVLPLVSVLANVAIAKAFSSGNTICATQEMLTLGFSNILGSFFSSMPTAGAFTRSAVISASGVRTTLAGLYVGIMALLALSFLTPHFYYIPRATLAAVLITAVAFIIDAKIVKLLWKGSRRDAIAAVVTFFVCTICGVEIGLLIGAAFNLIYLIRPSARPQIEVIECKSQSGKKYAMLRPDGAILYPAVNYFCNKANEIIRQYEQHNIPFVMNCEKVRYMDYTSVKGIEILSKNANAKKRRLWFTNIHPETYEIIQNLANIKHFHFIDEEEKVSGMFYDDVSTNNMDEEKEKLLESPLTSPTFVNVNDSKRCSETIGKTEVATKSEDTSQDIVPTSNVNNHVKN